MRLCKYCNKDISWKYRGALYCDWKCGERYRDKDGGKKNFFNPRHKSNMRWYKIGASSSLKAMEQIIKMFK